MILYTHTHTQISSYKTSGQHGKNILKEYKFEDIKIGLEEQFQVSITDKMLGSFCEITGDINPLHNDLEYAKSKGYNQKVVYGMLTSSFVSTLAGVYLPGKYSLIHSVEILFKKPVYLSDNPLTINGKVIEINETFKQFTIKFEILNSKQQKVVRGKMKVGVINE